MNVCDKFDALATLVEKKLDGASPAQVVPQPPVDVEALEQLHSWNYKPCYKEVACSESL